MQTSISTLFLRDGENFTAITLSGDNLTAKYTGTCYFMYVADTIIVMFSISNIILLSALFACNLAQMLTRQASVLTAVFEAS
jgi:hypothetical protein